MVHFKLKVVQFIKFDRAMGVLTPLCFPGCLFHLLSQTQRPHVGPDFFDIVQAFRLWTCFSNFSPAQRWLTIGKPDRILLFMIHNNFINSVVFFLVHLLSPFAPALLIFLGPSRRHQPALHGSFLSARLTLLMGRNFSTRGRTSPSLSSPMNLTRAR